ncbi:MAG: YlxR family protein [Deltaproteobacteria bacterium]|nr:YlxR family protein [Deltaproteobacteria bacterium]
MALGGFPLSDSPRRTCTGCRAVSAQADLVRVAFDGTRLALDPKRRLPGRGAYVHARRSCVTVPGLAKSLRRSVTPADISGLVSQMSPTDDNSYVSDRSPGQNGPGLRHRETVEIPSTARSRGRPA